MEYLTTFSAQWKSAKLQKSRLKNRSKQALDLFMKFRAVESLQETGPFFQHTFNVKQNIELDLI